MASQTNGAVKKRKNAKTEKIKNLTISDPDKDYLITDAFSIDGINKLVNQFIKVVKSGNIAKSQ